MDQKDILDEFGFTKYNENTTDLSEQLQVNDIGRLAARKYQEEHNHPKELWLDLPDWIDEEQRKKTLQEISNKSTEGPLVIKKDKCEYAIKLAQLYYTYKQEYNVIDFDDLLLLSYTRMMESDYKSLSYSNYHWIQIDEVQDLNNLQFAIIDKITATDGYTVMYLGDRQQAIYSFIGATSSGIDRLAQRCGNNILPLDLNYRSPKYLLDIFNTYARQQLRIDKKYLPEPKNKDDENHGFTYLFHSLDADRQCNDLTRIILDVTQKFPEERVAVLVRTNKAADKISYYLNRKSIEHFKLSGEDVFKSEEYKTLVAHFSVVQQDTNYLEWARILGKLDATYSFKDARGLVTKLRKAAVTPSDFIYYTYGDTYVKEFLKTYTEKELVIFDTETTGLNIFEDDIIQIAAIKVKNGQILPNSEFNVIIKTERVIPEMLGKEINPMLEVYKKGPLMEANDAFRAFLEYIGDDEILGHNVSYDYQILRYNLLRRLNGERIENHIRVYWDSLKLIRLLEPHLRVYKLKHLLSALGLEGQNTHRADDDILATKSVVDYCARRIIEILPKQSALWNDVNITNAAFRLKDHYGRLYLKTHNVLFEENCDSTRNPFMEVFESVYYDLLASQYIKPIERFDYMASFFRESLFKTDNATSFYQQINSHLADLKTFTQADLCESGVIKEKIYLMTVHKAKGLEFEHVILYDARDGIYPLFRSSNIEEEARLFYVGLSRAKKRISIICPDYRKSYRYNLDPNKYGFTEGWIHIHQQITPYLDCIRKYFPDYTMYKY